MKKKMTAVCALTCAAFLCACAAGQGEKTESIANMSEEAAASAEGQHTAEGTDPAEGQHSAEGTASADGQAADVQNGGTNENGQDASSAVPMQGLMHGNLGAIGSGFLAYTLPEQDGEDYRLCFYKEEDGKEFDFGKPLLETDYYPLELADYIFPDVRDNNVPIGKFIEIYFFDTITIGGDSTSGLAVVASYDVNGETCYDTRIYSWNGTGYSAEETLMQEFNEQYSNTQDYPVDKLYCL